MTGEPTIVEFPGRGPGEKTVAPRPLLLQEASTIVGSFPGIACLLGPEGVIEAANAAASPMLAALGNAQADPATAEKLLSFQKRAASGEVMAERIYCRRPDDPAAGPRAYDLIVLPTPVGALILGQESTLERNLIAALKASRELFRDLVTVSSDFAWETDASGAFTFVSRSGAAGFSAQALIGRLAESLLTNNDDDEGLSRSPFLAHEEMMDVEVWLHGADGAQRCYLVSAMPVDDPAKGWRGARGVGRDVTEVRLKERELAEARERERLGAAVLNAALKESDPDSMLVAAARAIREAVETDGCWLIERIEDRWTLTSAGCGMVRADESVPPFALSALAAMEKAPGKAFAFRAAGGSGIVAAANAHGHMIGGVCVWRDGVEHIEPRTESLIAGLTATLGVTLAHVGTIRRLETQSATDPLTGLLNRRSFLVEAARRLEHHRRMGRPAVLLYLDLDDFKQINDTRGHAMGDRVLQFVGEILRRRNRVGDLVVRFGGDEFGLWLEEADAAGANSKARQLIDVAREGGRVLGLTQGVSLSVGCAVFDPASPETLEGLMRRSDAALYKAKAAGKGIHFVDSSGFCEA
ncbi:MAG: sensor domain-containing diguanylate cyclase [Alphaproteobacteria bacterium]|nr:sensor domain-containing diguanylate cyclase [Alphaproteobacteria bacterium]